MGKSPGSPCHFRQPTIFSDEVSHSGKNEINKIQVLMVVYNNENKEIPHNLISV